MSTFFKNIKIEIKFEIISQNIINIIIVNPSFVPIIIMAESNLN